MIEFAWFALAGVKSAKSNHAEGDFFGSKAHNPRWISESFWKYFTVLD